MLGSTGSGKSHTVAKLLQESIKWESTSKNNSRIILFDVHGEYKSAFPDAHYLNASSLKLPYWLMDAQELEDFFIESNESNSHNQISQFRNAVIKNKQRHNPNITNLKYDAPLDFSIKEVCNYLYNLNNEKVDKKTGKPLVDHSSFFDQEHEFGEGNNGLFKGEFNRFVLRLKTKMQDERLAFILQEQKQQEFTLEQVYQQLLGTVSNNPNNITIIDLSTLPFEETSIVVSLVSRLMFQLCYYSKRLNTLNTVQQEKPILMVYEEAHRYIPESSLSKYNNTKVAIERIAKEGRKYGIVLMVVSQRPSEISETVFSQCNNFVVMRLTNANDQNYVKRLLPEAENTIIDRLPILGQGEALIVGDCITLPSLVQIDKCDPEPSSQDIQVYSEWKKDWRSVDLETICNVLQLKTETASQNT